MALIGSYQSIRKVLIINSDERSSIQTYLKGMVYVWCATRGAQPFAARDILGNVNRNWTNTPMQPLYDYYFQRGYTEKQAINFAGRAAGWLLMQVIHDDSRTFRTFVQYVRKYEWVQPTQTK